MTWTPGRKAAALPAAGLALVALVARLRTPSAISDDAFIVLATVRNALAGLGPHLDPGQSDAVLSTLLWPLAIAALEVLGLAPGAALSLLGLGAEIALVLVVYRLAQALGASPLASATAAALLATHPLLLFPSLGGMETALYLALLAGAALAWAKERAGLLALCAALLAWTRFDGLLAAAVFLAAARWRQRRAGRDERENGSERLWRAGLIGALTAPLLHRVVFGIWLPASVSAKIATGPSGWVEGAGQVALEFARATAGMSAYWLVEPAPHAILIPFALVGLWLLYRSAELRLRLAPLLLWSLAYVGAFVLSGRGYARNFPWYFTPPLLVLTVLAALGIDRLTARVELRAPRAALLAAILLPVAAGWFALGPVTTGMHRILGQFTAHRERAYAAAAVWLGRYGPARSIASNEIGAIAWWSPAGTEIVDLVGLSRRPGEAELSPAEMIAKRRPAAIIGRVDFRLPLPAAAARPGEYVWVKAGALDLGLEAALAAKLRPHARELERLYAESRRSP